MSLVSPAALPDRLAPRSRARLAAERLARPLLGAALLVPLLVYASVGFFARYTADDYCWAGILRSQGFLQAQVHWYTVYSPRYTFTFLVNLAELIGPSIVPFLPATAVAVWLAASTWTLSRFGDRLPPLGSVAAAFVVAEAIIFATLQSAPDLPQSLYWQTGMLTYLLPLILATFFLGWLRLATSRGLPPWALLVAAAVTFVAGGLSETYLIPQNVALTLALGVSLLRGQRRLASYLAAGLLGGVLALAVIVLAPSTAARVGGSPADLWLASKAAIATAAVLALRLARHFPVSGLVCLGTPLLLASLGRRPADADAAVRWRELALVTAGVVITLPFCFFPSFYAQNGNPPTRSELVPEWLMLAYVAYVGCALGPLARRFRASVAPLGYALAALGLALIPLTTAVLTLPDRASAAQYAALWDEEDRQIRAAQAAGARSLTVSPLPANLGEDYITPDPTNWFNGCVARYYGLDAIAAASGV